MTELHVISHRCVRISFSRPSQAACTNSHLLETGVEGTWNGHDPSVFFYTWREVGFPVLGMCMRHLHHLWAAGGCKGIQTLCTWDVRVNLSGV